MNSTRSNDLKLYKKKIKILQKLYHYQNGHYDATRHVSIYQEDVLTTEERQQLEQDQWKINDILTVDHDSLIQSIRVWGQHEALSLERATAEFVAAVGGSYPRGMTTLHSTLFAHHVPDHTYESARRLLACGICGFSGNKASADDENWENIASIRYSLYQGRLYNNVIGVYTDLEERIHLPAISPTEEDITIFRNLLQHLDQADEDMTPGSYEKSLTGSKLIKGNAGIRRDILQSLSLVGILPNSQIQMDHTAWTAFEDIIDPEVNLNNTKGRSDMEMPWAGWEGKLGVDWEKAHQLFGVYL